MKKRAVLVAGVFVLVVWSSPLLAQGTALPIPDGPVAQDIPGAKEIPDAKTEYKVLFDVGQAAPKDTDVNPMLLATARYLNTLAKVGVPPEHRKIAVVFHQGGTDIKIGRAHV